MLKFISRVILVSIPVFWLQASAEQKLDESHVKEGKYKTVVRSKDEFIERSKSFLSTGVDTEILRKKKKINIRNDTANVSSTTTETVKMPNWTRTDQVSFEETMTISVIDGQLKISEIKSKEIAMATK